MIIGLHGIIAESEEVDVGTTSQSSQWSTHVPFGFGPSVSEWHQLVIQYISPHSLPTSLDRFFFFWGFCLGNCMPFACSGMGSF